MTTLPYPTAPSLTLATTVMRTLTATDDSWTLTGLRLVLGGVMFPHGAQKLLGWFGGYGFTGSMEFFTGTLGLPWILGFAAILAETFGALALLAGVGTRIAALSITIVMVSAAWMVQLPNGFFMNWFGNQKGEGVEYTILMLALSITLTLRGGGRFSVDRFLNKQIR